MHYWCLHVLSLRNNATVLMLVRIQIDFRYTPRVPNKAFQSRIFSKNRKIHLQ
jgi:hypothetical protein